MSSAQPWDSLLPYLGRRTAGSVHTIDLDEARWPEASGVPPGMSAAGGAHALWQRSVEQSLPQATFKSVGPAIRAFRFVKSRSVIAILPANAPATAEALLAPDGFANWSIHSVRIDSGESALPVLAGGAVIAFEPIFALEGETFDLEDMILITEQGSEVLIAGLPRSATELEGAMRQARQ